MSSIKAKSEKSKTKTKRLPEIVENLHGVGITGLTSKLITRTDIRALYLRNDNVYEVFKIKVKEAGITPSGRTYPRREVYPNNEDFGNIAWCYDANQKEGYRYAKKKYDEI